MKEPEITQTALTEREQALLTLFRSYTDTQQQTLLAKLHQHGPTLSEKGRRGFYAGLGKGG